MSKENFRDNRTPIKKVKDKEWFYCKRCWYTDWNFHNGCSKCDRIICQEKENFVVTSPYNQYHSRH